MSKYIHKRHNVSVLIYHLVCPAKYRVVIFTEEADKTLRDICLDIAKRYEIVFLEIGVDSNHVHFLIQSVPTYSPTKITRIVKSITARKVFEQRPEVKEQLWGGEFWSDGYYINMVSKHGSEKTISQYVKEQGQEKEYTMLHKQELQLELF